MGTSESAPGFAVQITIDDTPCEEYEDEDAEDAPSHVTKHIQSTAKITWGVRATLETQKLQSTYSWLLDMSVDGQALNHYVLFTPQPNVHYNRHRPLIIDIKHLEYSVREDTFFSNFSFRDVKTTESPIQEKHKELLPQLAEVGCIELKLFRAVTIKRECPKPYISAKPDLMPNDIPEKAFKGRIVSQSFSMEGAQLGKASLSEHHWTDVDEGPVAVFGFRYASRESLQPLMIIPRSPGSSPTPQNGQMPGSGTDGDEESDDLDELSADQLRERLRSMQTLGKSKKRKSKLEEIKSELEDDSFLRIGASDEVQFTSSRPVKAARLQWGETIDLGDDG